jgi:hypothetical protein
LKKTLTTYWPIIVATIGTIAVVVETKSQVLVNTKRIDLLELSMTESKTDRARINAKLDDIKSGIDRLISMHLTNKP